MSGSKHEREYYLVNGRGENIYCRYWPPQLSAADTPRGVVLILHGHYEHSGMYEHIAQVLIKQELAVFAQDLAGFGRSEGVRGYIADYNHYVDDVIQHVDLIEEKYAQLPLFIVGHCLGGFITLESSMVLKDRVRGIVLLSPLDPRDDPDETLIGYIALNLLVWLCPQCIISDGFHGDQLCTDEEFIKKYDEDPFVWHQGFRVGFAAELDKGMAHLRSHMSEITCPLLLIHGDADPLTRVEGSEMLHSQAASKDKTINIYKGILHKVHNEPSVKERCLTSIADWIIART